MAAEKIIPIKPIVTQVDKGDVVYLNDVLVIIDNAKGLATVQRDRLYDLLMEKSLRPDQVNLGVTKEVSSPLQDIEEHLDIEPAEEDKYNLTERLNKIAKTLDQKLATEPMTVVEVVLQQLLHIRPWQLTGSELDDIKRGLAYNDIYVSLD